MNYNLNYDLTKKEDRIMAISNIEDSFTSTLWSIGIELCPSVVCKIDNRHIEIGIAEYDEKRIAKGYKVAFASTIDLYAKDDSIFGERGNEINLGSSGSFDNNVKESYWRTLNRFFKSGF